MAERSPSSAARRAARVGRRGRVPRRVRRGQGAAAADPVRLGRARRLRGRDRARAASRDADAARSARHARRVAPASSSTTRRRRPRPPPRSSALRRTRRRGRRVRRSGCREQRVPRRPPRAARLACRACSTVPPVRRIDLPSVHRGRAGAAPGRPVVDGAHRHRARRHAPLATLAPVRLTEPYDADPLAAVLGIEAPSHAAECQAVAGAAARAPPARRRAVVVDGGRPPLGRRRARLRARARARRRAHRRQRRAHGAARRPGGGGPARGGVVRRSTASRSPPSSPSSCSPARSGASTASGCGGCAWRCGTRSSPRAATRTGDELLVDALGAPGGFETIDAAPGRRAGAAREAARRRTRVAVRRRHRSRRCSGRSGRAAASRTEWGAQARGTGVLADEANRALDAAVALFAAAQRFVEREPDAPAVAFVDEVLASELPEDSLAPRRSAETVLVDHPAGRSSAASSTSSSSPACKTASGRTSGRAARCCTPGSCRACRGGRARRSAAARARDASPRPRASVRGDELRLFALAASRARAAARAQLHRQRRRAAVDAHGLRARAHPRAAPATAAPARSRRRAPPRGGHAATARRPPRSRCSPRRACPARIPTTGTDSPTPRPTAPLVDLEGDPEALVPVSPSQIDRAEESPLGWFVDHVASPPSGLAASIGTIVHAVVEEAGARDDGETGVEALWAAVEERWRELRFEAGWVAERERRGARRMAEGAADYLGELRRRREGAARRRGQVHAHRRPRAHHGHDRPGRGVARRHDGDRRPEDGAHARRPPRRPRRIRSSPPTSSPRATARCRRPACSGARSSSTWRRRSRGLALHRARPAAVRRRGRGGVPRTARRGRPHHGGCEFEGPAEPAHRSRFGAWQYRVHLVPAVSA